MRDVQMPLAIEDIVIPDGRREVDRAAVKRLADSIESVGLKHPITVRKHRDQYILVAGLHRLEACRKLGREHVPATISTMTNAEARMWEIAENLHRSDLTKLERAEQIAEWVDLVSRNLPETPREGRPGAKAAAARELGVTEDEVRRATKIAGITSEAREAAEEAGFDDNQSKLLEIAKAPPERQVATVHRLREVKMAAEPLSDAESIEIQVAALMASWNKASPEARKEFMARVDTPIMDRRYGA
jgi:ParB-like chromosome segregation protein Spo0J